MANGAREQNEPTAGEVFDVPVPFIRDTFESHDVDEEGVSSTTVPTWKPGTRCDGVGENCDYSADAMGRCVLTVVGVYRPGRYPARVFFTRKWITPDGKQFGKGKLRITTLPAFRALTRGWRHDFEMAKVGS